MRNESSMGALPALRTVASSTTRMVSSRGHCSGAGGPSSRREARYAETASVSTSARTSFSDARWSSRVQSVRHGTLAASSRACSSCWPRKRSATSCSVMPGGTQSTDASPPIVSSSPNESRTCATTSAATRSRSRTNSQPANASAATPSSNTAAVQRSQRRGRLPVIRCVPAAGRRRTRAHRTRAGRRAIRRRPRSGSGCRTRARARTARRLSRCRPVSSRRGR